MMVGDGLDANHATQRCPSDKVAKRIPPVFHTLRVGEGSALVFANGILLQQGITTLKDFIFRPLL